MATFLAPPFTGTSSDDLEINSGAAAEMFGQAGNDTIIGGTGTDTIRGGEGNDAIDGGPSPGFNAIFGDSGDDTIAGGLNNPASGNFIDGGANGTSTFPGDWVTYFSSTQHAIVNLGWKGADVTHYQGLDPVVPALPDQHDATAGATGNAAFWDALTNVENLQGSSFADNFLGDDGSNILLGKGGDDKLDGSAGDDAIAGGTGLDNIFGGSGNDVLIGDDYNAFPGSPQSGDGKNVLDGGSGNDSIVAGGFGDTETGGAGNDWLLGAQGADNLSGNAGNDNFLAGAGNDIIHTEGLNSNGIDWVQTGSGDDTIFVDGSQSWITVFDMAVGVPVGPIQDEVNLAGSTGIHDFATLMSGASDFSGGGITGVVIKINASSTLFLQGATKAQLASSDFIFN